MDVSGITTTTVKNPRFPDPIVHSGRAKFKQMWKGTAATFAH
jgi:hypothetical protein